MQLCRRAERARYKQRVKNNTSAASRPHHLIQQLTASDVEQLLIRGVLKQPLDNASTSVSSTLLLMTCHVTSVVTSLTVVVNTGSLWRSGTRRTYRCVPRAQLSGVKVLCTRRTLTVSTFYSLQHTAITPTSSSNFKVR